MGADRCRHRFSYALYPHAGNEAEGDVARQAYELGYTPQVVYAPAGEGADQVPEAGSLLEIYGDVVVESVKKAWREDAVVVRLYEPKGQNESATVTFCMPFAEAVLCDLMEENELPACSGDDTVSLELSPFEIVTLKFYLTRPEEK
ncbi:MAG: glycosyl hydrolase-related protein [Oscillospiraceae bacterium]